MWGSFDRLLPQPSLPFRCRAPHLVCLRWLHLLGCMPRALVCLFVAFVCLLGALVFYPGIPPLLPPYKVEGRQLWRELFHLIQLVLDGFNAHWFNWFNYLPDLLHIRLVKHNTNSLMTTLSLIDKNLSFVKKSIVCIICLGQGRCLWLLIACRAQKLEINVLKFLTLAGFLPFFLGCHQKSTFFSPSSRIKYFCKYGMVGF